MRVRSNVSDVARVAAFVALLGAVLAAFAGLAVVMADAFADPAIANPMSELTSIATLGGIGAAVGLGYGVVTGLVVALVRRTPIPARGVVAAAIVFAIAVSALGDHALSLVLGATSLARIDGSLPLAARVIPASIVALIAWQEAGTPQVRTVASVGQAGRAQRR